MIGILILPALLSTNGGQQEVATTEQVQALPRAQVGPATNDTLATWAQAGNRPFLAYASENRRSEQAIEQAAKALRQAETSEAQDTARKDLTKLLSADYDSRLADYDEYLEGMEKQLEELREKLAKRREAKDKMVELRIKVLEAEADDLGWPSRMEPSRMGGSIYVAPRFPAAGGSSLGVSGFAKDPFGQSANPPRQPTRPTTPNQGYKGR